MSKVDFPKEDEIKLKIHGEVLNRASINPIVKRRGQIPVMPVPTKVKSTNISKNLDDTMKTVNPQLSIIPKRTSKRDTFLDSILSDDGNDSDEDVDIDSEDISPSDDLYIEVPIESLGLSSKSDESPESKDQVPPISTVPPPPVNPSPHPPPPTYVRKVIKTKKKIIKKEESTRPDYAKLSDKERSVYRLNFRNKFDLLKRWYPGLSIPVGVEDHEDLDYVHSVYEVCLSFMYQQINSSFYRGALLMSWIALEAAGTLWLGLDVSGYCQQQMDMLWIYEPLINEMSKVDLTSITEGWSPFQKIIGLVVGSFALMIFVRMVVGKMGTAIGMNLSGFSTTITGFIANMFAQKPQPVSQVADISSVGPTAVHGLATMPVPPPPRSADNQVGMAQDAMRMMHLVSGGRAGSTGSSVPTVPTVPSVPSGPPPPVTQPKMPTPPSTQPKKMVIKKPTYDS
jgi:hypothetical protein